MHRYEILDFNEEFYYFSDEAYGKHHHLEITSNYTMEKAEKIIGWIDEHSNYSFSAIEHRFRRIKLINYISSFKQCIERNRKRFEKLVKIKEFMLAEFYTRQPFGKEALYCMLSIYDCSLSKKKPNIVKRIQQATL